MLPRLYFSKPETITAKVINFPAFDSVLHILDLVSQDADNDVIEAGFKRDAYFVIQVITLYQFGRLWFVLRGAISLIMPSLFWAEISFIVG